MELIGQLIPYIVTIVAIVLVYFFAEPIYKLTKFRITRAMLEPTLAKIANWMMNLENDNVERMSDGHAYYSGKLKKQMIIEKAEKELSDKEKRLMTRLLGGVGSGVQWTFDNLVQPKLIAKIGKYAQKFLD